MNSRNSTSFLSGATVAGFVNNPLVVLLSVADYDGLNNSLPSISKDLTQLSNMFSNVWRYHVLYRNSCDKPVCLQSNHTLPKAKQISSPIPNTPAPAHASATSGSSDGTDSTDSHSPQTPSRVQKISLRMPQKTHKQVKQMKQPKLRWSSQDLDALVEDVRNYLTYNKHNGLIFIIASYSPDASHIMRRSSAINCTYDQTSPSINEPPAFLYDSDWNRYDLKKILNVLDSFQNIPKVFFIHSEAVPLTALVNMDIFDKIGQNHLNPIDSNETKLNNINSYKLWVNSIASNSNLFDANGGGSLFLQSVIKTFMDIKHVLTHDVSHISEKLIAYCSVSVTSSFLENALTIDTNNKRDDSDSNKLDLDLVGTGPNVNVTSLRFGLRKVQPLLVQNYDLSAPIWVWVQNYPVPNGQDRTSLLEAIQTHFGLVGLVGPPGQILEAKPVRAGAAAAPASEVDGAGQWVANNLCGEVQPCQERLFEKVGPKSVVTVVHEVRGQMVAETVETIDKKVYYMSNKLKQLLDFSPECPRGHGLEIWSSLDASIGEEQKLFESNGEVSDGVQKDLNVQNVQKAQEGNGAGRCGRCGKIRKMGCEGKKQRGVVWYVCKSCDYCLCAKCCEKVVFDTEIVLVRSERIENDKIQIVVSLTRAKGEKAMQVTFDFSLRELVIHVAREMVSELLLPKHCLKQVENVIKDAIGRAQTKAATEEEDGPQGAKKHDGTDTNGIVNGVPHVDSGEEKHVGDVKLVKAKVDPNDSQKIEMKLKVIDGKKPQSVGMVFDMKRDTASAVAQEMVEELKLPRHLESKVKAAINEATKPVLTLKSAKKVNGEANKVDICLKLQMPGKAEKNRMTVKFVFDKKNDTTEKVAQEMLDRFQLAKDFEPTAISIIESAISKADG